MDNDIYKNRLGLSYRGYSPTGFVTAASVPLLYPAGQQIGVGSMDVNSILDKLWKKMFEKPAIIPCAHCNSHNAYTNPVCVSCGAPMGNSNLR